jgi:amino-acid N-acetyltransferase
MASEDIELRHARHQDRSRLIGLLTSAGLPSADVDLVRQVFTLAVKGEEVVGSVGLELYGEAALLRSLVVTKSHRGQGLGDRLYRHALTEAAQSGVISVYLLTTTAAPYFAARGFREVSRQTAPPPLRASAEFATLCPATAVLMRLSIALA